MVVLATEIAWPLLRCSCTSHSCLVFAGVKSGHALKRTTSSRISTHVLEEPAAIPSSVTPQSVQQDRHSLLDTDSLLSLSMPDLCAAAAASDCDYGTSSENPEPAKADAPKTVPMVPPLSQPRSPAHPSPTEASTAEPSPDQHAVDVGPAHTGPTAHPQPPASPAEPAALQTASLQRSISSPTTIDFLPGKTQGVNPAMTMSIESAVEDSKLVAPPTVPLGSPQAAPIDALTVDKVAPNGCLHMFCCSKAPSSTQKTKGSVLMRCQQVFRKGRR